MKRRLSRIPKRHLFRFSSQYINTTCIIFEKKKTVQRIFNLLSSFQFCPACQWTSFARQWYTNDINDKVVNGKLEEDSEGRSEDSRKIEDDRMSTRSNNSMVDQNAVISELLDKVRA